ncbi:MAG: PAC2 family protein [Acidimicrobiia bacterium]|nr:PAC2 family protein [Acidimicrobiia bacterium]
MIRFTTVSEPTLEQPVLLCSFDGWVNAGEAGTAAAEFLGGGGEEIVVFDSDDLFDYRDTRPTLEFDEGVVRSVSWPAVGITHRNISDRDVLILTGTEPSLGWVAFARTVGDIAERFGVTELLAMGGIPWATPHTRPSTLIVTASSRERLGDFEDHPQGGLSVPSSVSGALETEFKQRGIPTTGYWARVPNYLGTRYWESAIRLLERVDLHLGLGLDLSDLLSEAETQRVHLDAIADGRPDIRSMVDQLEELFDAGAGDSGEQLASEIERFLRNRSEGDFD